MMMLAFNRSSVLLHVLVVSAGKCLSVPVRHFVLHFNSSFCSELLFCCSVFLVFFPSFFLTDHYPVYIKMFRVRQDFVFSFFFFFVFLFFASSMILSFAKANCILFVFAQFTNLYVMCVIHIFPFGVMLKS